MNTALLLKTADFIEANPHYFDMGTWIQHQHNCNTTACVAGTICILAGKADTFSADVWHEAQKLLGVETTYNPRAPYINPLADKITPELFLARSMDWNEFDDEGDHRSHDGPETINACYAEHVPSALRWMVANDTYNWRRAFHSLGVLLPHHEQQA